MPANQRSSREEDERTVPLAASTYSSAVAEADAYTDWILSLVAPHLSGRILEVGVAHGSFTERLANGDYVGIDIDKTAVGEARERFHKARFEVADIADSDAMSVIEEGSIDTIICFNVLEHVENHRQALDNLLRLLRPGGYLLLYVPAHAALYNDLDRLAGHFRRYNRKLIDQVFTGLPACVEKARYVNPIGGIGWWVNRGVRHDDLDGKGVNEQIRFFMRYLLPVSGALGVVTGRFFGQSLLVEARRI